MSANKVPGRDGLIFCSRCGEPCVAGYNKSVCPDCVGVSDTPSPWSATGNEDMVSHFEQDPGNRLLRMRWRHFPDNAGDFDEEND